MTARPVTQPKNVRPQRTGDCGIVRHADPNGVEVDEWKLYGLAADPIARTNLVDFRTGQVRSDVSVPDMTAEKLIAMSLYLKEELARQQIAMRGTTT